MKLLECFIQSKTGNMDVCEDEYFINKYFACVIDGATNVSGHLIEGMAPGRFAAKLIKKAMSTLQGKETIEEVIHVINMHYDLHLKQIECDNTSSIPPSASVIIFSKYHRKIWMIGDCQAYLEGVNYQNIKKVDEVFSEVRSIIMKSELKKGKKEEALLKEDIGFELIKPLIQRQYSFQNGSPDCELSYSVVNGQAIPKELIVTVDVPSHVQTISLGSDGYPKLFESLEKTEAYLKKILLKDPLCIEENIETKGMIDGHLSFDDRTYLKVKIDSI